MLYPCVVQLRDFVVVEFARAWQEERGAALVDPQVAAAVRVDPPPDDEGRLLAYSRALIDTRLGDGTDGRRAVEGLRAALFTFGILLPILGAIAGAATLRAALPPNDVRPVNILQFVGAAVLVPTAFLLFTTTVTSLGARASAASHWVVWALSAVRGRLLQTPAGRLTGRVLRRSGVTAPLLASYSHRFWNGAFLAFLVLGFWRFASEDYLFAWSSTLPDFQVWMERLATGLATAVPGVDAPSVQAISVSEFASLDGIWLRSSGDPAVDEELRKGWWRVLLGSAAILGLLPRIIGLIVAQVQVSRGISWGLASAWGKAVLGALEPVIEATRHGDGSAREPQKRTGLPEVVDEAHLRGLAIVPFATAAPAPSLISAAGLDRLGISDLVLPVPSDDDRVAMAAVTARVGDAEAAPGGVVVVFDFASTPDRVREQFLQDVARALPGTRPVHVLLSGVDRFRCSPRGGRTEARRESWLAMAERAGVPESRVHVPE